VCRYRLYLIVMKRFFLPLLFLIIGILAYFPSFSAKLFWDDEDFVTKNQYVIDSRIDKFFTAQAIEGAGKPSNYFRPVQFTIYSLLYRAFGPNDFVFHAANIFFHILAAYAVFIFLQFLLKSFRFPDTHIQIPQLNLLFLTVSDLTISPRTLLSLMVSLIFLIHPVQTEAVSYVSGLSDPLNALFGFTSLLFFLFATKPVIPAQAGIHQPKSKYPTVDSYTSRNDEVFLHLSISKLLLYFISILLFILALGSKETGVIFPFLLIALTILLPGKPHERIRRVGATIPFVFLVVCYLLYHAKIDVMNMASAWGDHPYTNSVFIRIAQFLSLLPQYITILLFPLKLVYEHDFMVRILTTIFEPIAFLSFGAILFVAIELFVLFRTSKYFSLILFSFIGFFIAFVPYTGLVLINGIMYEHFLYIPLVFFFLFIVLIGREVILGMRVHHKIPIFFIILHSIFVILIIRSWVRQYTWADPARFFVTTLKDAPTSFRVHNNLGRIYEDAKQYPLAQTEYEDVIKLNPTLPHGYHNLAHLLLEEGKIPEAEQNFLKAIEVDPYFSYSYISLMELYTNTNQNQKKTDIQKRIQERFPQNIR
jgi:protein O-mannosyl-transferase